MKKEAGKKVEAKERVGCKKEIGDQKGVGDPVKSTIVGRLRKQCEKKWRLKQHGRIREKWREKLCERLRNRQILRRSGV